ncbi:MAG: hypothetical protein QW548_02715 [Candidatus Aenigmatarchaeota archaeon]
MRGLAFEPFVVIGIIALVVVALYVAGGVIGKQSVSIGNCRAEWDTVARMVQSELCPNASVPCMAEPYVMQHNAIVDVLLCACANAAPSYADAVLNKQIEDVYKASTDITLTAREICEGGQLAKWRYRG